MGDRGTAVMINDRIDRWEFAEALPEDAIVRNKSTPEMKVGSSDPKAISNEGHRKLVHDLTRALIEGRPPAIPGAEARRAVALVLAIYEAAQSGRSAKVSPS